jgi:hypothetical protein
VAERSIGDVRRPALPFTVNAVEVQRLDALMVDGVACTIVNAWRWIDGFETGPKSITPTAICSALLKQTTPYDP